MRRNSKVALAVGALLVAAGAVGVTAHSATRPGLEVDAATVALEDVAVTITATGEVEPGSRYDVFPRAAGVLIEVGVTDGEEVRAGTVLARLDPQPLDLAVSQAKSAVAQAEAALANVERQEPADIQVVAARRSVEAAAAAYRSALAAQAAVARQAPSRDDLAAAAAATAAAEAAHDQARQSYEAFVAQHRLEPTPTGEASVSAARVAVKQAEAALLAARAAEGAAITFDLTVQREAANAAVEQARAAHDAARAQLDSLEALDLSLQLRSAQAAVAQAHAALAVAEENRANADIVAPIDGVVLFNPLGTPLVDGSAPRAARGVSVTPQMAPFSIVDLSSLRFVAEVDEVDVARVKRGMVGAVRLDALPGSSFETTATEIRPVSTLTPTGGTVFPVVFQFSDPERSVLIGMRGDVTIEVGRSDDVMALPVEALFDGEEGSFVFVIGEDNRLERRQIRLGVLTETQAEVVSGLEVGERVALAGADELSDGIRVRVR